METLETLEEDHPGVSFPAPLLLAVAFALGVVTQHFLSAMPVPRPLRILVGAPFQIGAMVVNVWTASLFWRFRTSFIPNKASRTLIVGGPFRFSRNPVYIALTVLYIGLSLCTGYLWALPFLLPAMVLIRYYVVAREEQYLERRFGSAYEEYRKRVPRWV